MKVFIAWAGDNIGKRTQDAIRANDASKLRQMSQAIEHGTSIWRSWVEEHGGSVVAYSGSDGSAEIDASHLEDIPRLRQQYESAIGGPSTVGIGRKLVEADRALICGKLKGGSQVVLYTSDVEHEIQRAQERMQKGESPVSPEMSSPALAEGQGNAGMSGAHAPAPAKAPEKPKVEGSEHSQGEAAAAFVDENHVSPETTNAAQDLEDQFHEAAGESDEDDEPESEDPHVIKQRVVQVLQEIKRQAKTIAKLKEAAPDAYKAVMDMVTEMINIARQIPGASGGAEVQKHEPAFTEAGFLHKPSGVIYGTGRFHDIWKLPTEYNEDEYLDGFITPDGRFLTREQAADLLKRPEGGNLQSEDLKDMGLGRQAGEEAAGRRADDPRIQKGETRERMEAPQIVYRIENAQHEGPYKAGVVQQDDNNPNQPPAHTDFDPAVFEAMDSHGYKFGFENQQQAINWFGQKTFQALRRQGFSLVRVRAKHIWHSKSGTQCIYEPEEHLGKSSLPMPHATPHHHVKWPVGAVNQNKQRIKVQHQDGAAPAQAGWVQVQDGQVLSHDGHAISARNPGGR